MKSKHFLILVALALVAVLAAWLTRSVPQQSGTFGAGVLAGGEKLLPELQAQANDIETLQVIGANNTPLVTLSRGEKNWTIAERNDYPADWTYVRQLLRELSQAEVIAPKTARSEFHARLGLADVDTDNTGGGLIRWGDKDNQALLIGIESPDVTGRYVRHPDSNQTYLVDQELRVKSEPADWIDAEIIDWQASRLQEVTLRHADGVIVRLDRATPNALEMQLANLPEGREISGQWAINGITNSLVGLMADDVRKATSELPDTSSRVLFLSSNGINLVLTLFTESLIGDDGEQTQYYLRADVTQEPGADTAADISTALGAGNEDEDNPGIEVAAMQEKLNGWDFIIPEFKYNAINKTMEDLLKPLPEEPINDDTDEG